MYACNGILFNHESPRRGEPSTRKITRGWRASTLASITACSWATLIHYVTGATPATMWRCGGGCCSKRGLERLRSQRAAGISAFHRLAATQLGWGSPDQCQPSIGREPFKRSVAATTQVLWWCELIPGTSDLRKSRPYWVIQQKLARGSLTPTTSGAAGGRDASRMDAAKEALWGKGFTVMRGMNEPTAQPTASCGWSSRYGRGAYSCSAGHGRGFSPRAAAISICSILKPQRWLAQNRPRWWLHGRERRHSCQRKLSFPNFCWRTSRSAERDRKRMAMRQSSPAVSGQLHLPETPSNRSAKKPCLPGRSNQRMSGMQ